ncbi:MAG: hypothetical protein ACO1RX_11310 [Candidatus Sericytochromatia bacterium]
MSGLEFPRSPLTRGPQPTPAPASDKSITAPAQPPVAPPETEVPLAESAAPAPPQGDTRTQSTDVKFSDFDNAVAFTTPSSSGGSPISSVNRLQLAPELLDSDEISASDDVVSPENLVLGGVLSKAADHEPSLEAESYILGQGYDPNQIRDLLRGAALQYDPASFERLA